MSTSEEMIEEHSTSKEGDTRPCSSEALSADSGSIELETELDKIKEQIEQNSLDSNPEKNVASTSLSGGAVAAEAGDDSTRTRTRTADEIDTRDGKDSDEATKGDDRDEQDSATEKMSEEEEKRRRQLESQMTEEEREEKRREAQVEKNRGNELFRDQEHGEAAYAYTKGLELCPLTFEKDRSVMLANRAACKVKLEQFEDAVEDCSKALALDAVYLKVLLRRAQCHEKLEKLEDALEDYQKVLELDRSNQVARERCMRLPDEIKERNEKLKGEMMGKLKELGNMVLKPFGLSTNNFQMQQDPNSGSYSVNFVQNAAASPSQ